ncbi:MAG: phenylacetate--CoA ligase family protein [Alphaproteobacteria bacterium]|nr:phenylacetate--CoA ligase family protein [Alphaproteobacteria bacterium]
MPVPHSGIDGVHWPALPTNASALVLAVLQQLEESQGIPPDVHRDRQLRQLARLVGHAARTVPYYRDALAAFAGAGDTPIAPAQWAALPTLTRRDVQNAGTALHSTAVPPQHGAVVNAATSGSTGTPLTVRKTALVQLFWDAFTLREERWHRRDLGAKFAAIRNDERRPADFNGPLASRFDDWGPPVASTYPTGPAVMLDVRCSLAEQIAWLQRETPAYLLSFGLNLLFLARHSIEHGIALPSLRGVRSSGEVLPDEARAACRAAWGVEISDVYSAVEVGHIALQCAEYGRLHVQAENLLVEILDGEGRPCAPGEVGRVVVTALHNFAMPLIRYEIGDLAEVGSPCPCGRTLPVIARVLGRTRALFFLPSGERIYPYFAQKMLAAMPSIIQHQIVQRSTEEIELRLVARRRLTAEEEARIRDTMVAGFGHPFRVAFRYCDDIPRNANGKYEDLRVELSGAPPL